MLSMHFSTVSVKEVGRVRRCVQCTCVISCLGNKYCLTIKLTLQIASLCGVGSGVAGRVVAEEVGTWHQRSL